MVYEPVNVVLDSEGGSVRVLRTSTMSFIIGACTDHAASTDIPLIESLKRPAIFLYSHLNIFVTNPPIQYLRKHVDSALRLSLDMLNLVHLFRNS